MKCLFTPLQIYMFKMSVSIEISAKLVLWCYPAKKLEKKGLQAVSPIMVFSKHIGVIRSKDPKSSNVLL